MSQILRQTDGWTTASTAESGNTMIKS